MWDTTAKNPIRQPEIGGKHTHSLGEDLGLLQVDQPGLFRLMRIDGVLMVFPDPVVMSGEVINKPAVVR